MRFCTARSPGPAGMPLEVGKLGDLTRFRIALLLHPEMRQYFTQKLQQLCTQQLKAFHTKGKGKEIKTFAIEGLWGVVNCPSR